MYSCHTPTTYHFTLSLHDALPIYRRAGDRRIAPAGFPADGSAPVSVATQAAHFHVLRQTRHRKDALRLGRDRKSTRLNSSHLGISYAVFCLKKKTIDIRTEYVHGT